MILRFHFEMGSDVDSSGTWTTGRARFVDSVLDCARENSGEGLLRSASLPASTLYFT